MFDFIFMMFGLPLWVMLPSLGLNLICEVFMSTQEFKVKLPEYTIEQIERIIYNKNTNH
ncbi:Uncharacterised protein [Escherichia coli]|nr:Uncharacterised protein [Escherichia coli]